MPGKRDVAPDQRLKVINVFFTEAAHRGLREELETVAETLTQADEYGDASAKDEGELDSAIEKVAAGWGMNLPGWRALLRGKVLEIRRLIAMREDRGPDDRLVLGMDPFREFWPDETPVGHLVLNADFVDFDPSWTPEGTWTPESESTLRAVIGPGTTKTVFLEWAREFLDEYWTREVEPLRGKHPNFRDRQREIQNLKRGVRAYIAWARTQGYSTLGFGPIGHDEEASRWGLAQREFVRLWPDEPRPTAEEMQREWNRIQSYLAAIGTMGGAKD